MEFLLLFVFLLQIVLVLLLMSFTSPLPLSDLGTVRYRTLPWMTMTLIVVNSLVFMAWQAPYMMAETEAEFYPAVEQVYTFGLRQSSLTQNVGVGAWSIFTSMFMHGDLLHLLGNMIYLWAFGRRLEDACGHGRFLLFYLLAGLVAGLGSVALDPASADTPRVGASGAISGVMGGYLLLFPGAKVYCWWGIGSILRIPVVAVGKALGVKALRDIAIFSRSFFIRAWLLIIPWALLQVAPSLEVIGGREELAGVDTLAHMSGFLAAILIFLFVRKDLLVRYVAGRAA